MSGEGQLPDGWVWTTLRHVADTSLGKMLDKAKSPDAKAVPYLRNSNIQWGRIDLDDVKEMRIPADEQEFFALAPGDLLVCEGGEIGRAAIWRDSTRYMAFQKALHRVRPNNATTADYLRYFLEHLSGTGGFDKLSTGSTIKHLPQQQLRQLPIPLPPLAEQRRIIEALEDHLSRLDTAQQSIEVNLRRAKLLARRIIVEAIPIPGPAHWKHVTVADAGRTDLGRQRHPDWHTGPNMRPYLRVANVFEDRIDASDLMEMDFPDEVFERFRVHPGDILLNEGQSPEYLGRPAMYRGTPADVAFTNSLLRFRANAEVDPEWALLVFRRHMHAGRFVKEVRITTNIAHLSAARFKSVEFPIPPIDEQNQIVNIAKEQLAGVDRLVAAIASAQRRADHLRRSLLAEAFSGRLVPQDPADEPASELLARIEAERASLLAATKAKSVQLKRTTAPTARPPKKTTTVPAGIQEELPL